MTDRQPEDFYATHPCAVEPLMKVLGWENGGRLIWEPCCGQGHLANIMQLYGHKVVCTDLIDRGFGVGGVDFLKPSKYYTEPWDAIITNPPYSFALECVQRSIELAPVCCHFLNIKFLESAKRRKFFAEFPPRYVCVFSSRVASSKNGIFPHDEQGTVCYAWFVWFRGFKGRPEIIWL